LSRCTAATCVRSSMKTPSCTTGPARVTPSLIRDLGQLAGIGPDSRVVEIGPGTGQATAALTALGASVTAVELGAALAAVLRRKDTEAATAER